MTSRELGDAVPRARSALGRRRMLRALLVEAADAARRGRQALSMDVDAGAVAHSVRRRLALLLLAID